ncbi:fibronectin type III-like domain-contianing protein [Deinococcus malanensis]|uniref:fibronectin type III-like domain-contianing protein n=1 Tax=Deinococcus malanensis TaxID=1706855 RepID=UPI003630A71A
MELEPGGDQMVTLSVDPRTLATWDTAAREWRIARGAYRVMVGTHSRDVKETETVHLPERRLPAGWRPGS